MNKNHNQIDQVEVKREENQMTYGTLDEPVQVTLVNIMNYNRKETL